MQNADRMSSLFFLALGLFILIYSLWTLPIGTVYAPEPGFFPLLVGIVMTSLALVLVIRAFSEKAAMLPQFESRWTRVLFTSATILLYVFFMELAGFLLSTSLFVLFYLKAIEKVGWMGSLLFTIPTVCVTYFSFTYLLGVPLPRGVIPF